MRLNIDLCVGYLSHPSGRSNKFFHVADLSAVA
jgi:hypothetical protein